MEALLHHSLSPREVGVVSALGLAHMGDAVYEILVRSMLVLDGHTTSGHLHKDTTAYVCAPAQAAAIERLLPHLTEEESGYYRRGRNAAYLLGRTERIRQLFTILMEDRHAT